MSKAEEVEKEFFLEEGVIGFDIKELERRLERQQEILRGLETSHKGNEQNLTYHAGYELGYVKGKIAEIENTIDLLKELR